MRSRTLTPIQLAAERLKRKYLKQIVDDPETFQVCTDTIVRQVGDIGRMVDEFSAFARMPAPVMQSENIVELCRQSLFLQQSAHPHVTYHVIFPPTPLLLNCDATLVGRALGNLLQNAADSIEGRSPMHPAGGGEIWLTLGVAAGDTFILIEDNGRGLPKAERHRLTEPYVTTRAEGDRARPGHRQKNHGGARRQSDIGRPAGWGSLGQADLRESVGCDRADCRGGRSNEVIQGSWRVTF
jgi:Signal transduction histidine kinase involved in nitrogen fixation and metabolism regulation